VWSTPRICLCSRPTSCWATLGRLTPSRLLAIPWEVYLLLCSRWVGEAFRCFVYALVMWHCVLWAVQARYPDRIHKLMLISPAGTRSTILEFVAHHLCFMLQR
jgi:hypothetical protein